MATNKVGIPKGTRDFSTVEMLKRNYIFDTIKKIFKIHGFQAIETPAMENLSSLMGKYGEEGDKLMFKVLNSGDFLSKVDSDTLNSDNSIQLANKICEKGLRYDLTVPLARFVVQNRNNIVFPFKRYQIQPVWRADRPQKGRYREFYQCDVDIIGSNSLLNELELIQITSQVFNELNISTIVKINNRKILSGIAEIINQSDKIIDITVAIDKLEKIGIDKVNEELLSKDIPKDAIEKIQPIILLEGSTDEKLKVLKEFLENSEIGMKGVEELETLFEYIDIAGVEADIDLDLSLARGLNYYTGAIIEVKSKDVSIGSICGGGRYDNLTGIFGLADVSGVGISFGADRIYDVLEQLDQFPSFYFDRTEVLFLNFGKEEEKFCIPIVDSLRKNGVHAEIYPDSVKMKKQMIYANKREIPFVAIIGSAEISENKVVIKTMETGEQKELNTSDVLKFFREKDTAYN